MLAQGSDLPALARIEAWVRQQRGEMALAVQAYGRVLQGEPADAASWNNLGNIHAAAGHFDQAINAFEHAITYQPDEVGMYLNLADVLRQADLGEPRLKVARDAVEVAPDSRAAQTELGMALAHNELLDEAIIVLEAAVQRWPDFGEAQLELGRLYEATNRTEALAAFLASLDPAACPPEVAFLHAWLAQREGRFEDAARHAEAIPTTIHPMRRAALMGNIAETLELLHQIRELGVSLSIDDFGTGYSSLAYLKRLPVDELKIDRSFVMNMETDLQDAKIVHSTVELAHNLGLSVVAEGVEGAKHWKLLAKLGCDEAQSFFIAKPMPDTEFMPWLEQWHAPDTEAEELGTAFAALS